MFKKAGGKNLVGLDIGSSSVKAVELQKKGSNLQLMSLGFENLQPDTIVDGQIMELNDVANVISSIFNEHQIKTCFSFARLTSRFHVVCIIAAASSNPKAVSCMELHLLRFPLL